MDEMWICDFNHAVHNLGMDAESAMDYADTLFVSGD